MDAFKDILLILIQAIIVTAVPILIKFVIDLLKAKSGQIKDGTASDNIKNIIDTVTRIVSEAVLYVSQTYVDALKKDGKFNKEEQEIAFALAFDRIMLLIDEESKAVLTSVFVDLGLWLHTLIEATIKLNKIEIEKEAITIVIPEAPEVIVEECVIEAPNALNID